MGRSREGSNATKGLKSGAAIGHVGAGGLLSPDSTALWLAALVPLFLLFCPVARAGDSGGGTDTGSSSAKSAPPDPDVLAIFAAGVHEQACVDAASGSSVTKQGNAMAAVSTIWADLGAEWVDSAVPSLLYWRAKLGLCLHAAANVESDLETFIERVGDDPVFKAQVDDARRQLLRLGLRADEGGGKDRQEAKRKARGSARAQSLGGGSREADERIRKARGSPRGQSPGRASRETNERIRKAHALAVMPTMPLMGAGLVLEYPGAFASIHGYHSDLNSDVSSYDPTATAATAVGAAHRSRAAGFSVLGGVLTAGSVVTSLVGAATATQLAGKEGDPGPVVVGTAFAVSGAVVVQVFSQLAVDPNSPVVRGGDFWTHGLIRLNIGAAVGAACVVFGESLNMGASGGASRNYAKSLSLTRPRPRPAFAGFVLPTERGVLAGLAGSF